MTSDDPLFALIAARNPLPDPDELTAEQRASADALRLRVQEATPARTRHSRPVRAGLVLAAGVVPALLILLVSLGTGRSIRSPVGPAGAPGLPISTPAPGAPQTLLLIGSDHRFGEPYRTANTDTMILIRFDPASSTINVLSIPRDLKVQIPDGSTSFTGKLNAAYSVGGPNEILGILRTQVFAGQDFHVNHVIDVNFSGFSDLIDAIGCVYSDVDHRYYNDTVKTGYSSIDIQPGYQRLCGDHSAATGALAFVRYRHADSDLVREARAQDFIRWARQNFTGAQLFANRDKLIAIFAAHAQTDESLHSADAVENLLLLLVNSAGHPLKSIPFPAQLAPCSDGSSPCYLTVSKPQAAAAYHALLTPTTGTAGTSTTAQRSPGGASDGGLVSSEADGQAQAAALGDPGLPIAYPAQILAHSEYCSDVTGNCDDAGEPAGEYAGSYPRAYDIDGPGGHAYPAYAMTLEINRSLGEYYGVQGTTWQDPPILKDPTRTEEINGRQLLEYDNGGKLSLVAWRTPAAVYWISNTLTDSIPNDQLIAIAASLRVAP